MQVRLRLACLALLLLSLLLSPVRAQPHLPRPQGLGIHCPLLLSCPATDDTALHLGWQLALSAPRDRPAPHPPSADAVSFPAVGVGGALSASVTLARWIELGGTFTGHWSHAFGRLSGPLTLWARLTPPPLRGLLSDYKDEGLTLGAELRQAITTPPLDASGHLFPDAESLSVLGEYRKNRFTALGQVGFDLGNRRDYRGGHVGAGLWVTLLQGDVTMRVGGEAFAQIPDLSGGWGGPQLALSAGLQVWEPSWGISAGAGYIHRTEQDELAWSVILFNGYSFGGRHQTSAQPLPFLEPLGDALRDLFGRPWMPELWKSGLPGPASAAAPPPPGLRTPLGNYLSAAGCPLPAAGAAAAVPFTLFSGRPCQVAGDGSLHLLPTLAASPWDDPDPAGPRLNHPRPRGWGLLGPKGEGERMPPGPPPGPRAPQVLSVPEAPPAAPPPRMPPYRVVPPEAAASSAVPPAAKVASTQQMAQPEAISPGWAEALRHLKAGTSPPPVEIAPPRPARPPSQFGSGKPPHVATIVIERGGQEVHRETLRSGGMTPEERALGFPKNTLATHTEVRASHNPALQPGDVLRIDGKYEPCKPCIKEMNSAARSKGVTVVYTWPGGTWTNEP